MGAAWVLLFLVLVSWAPPGASSAEEEGSVRPTVSTRLGRLRGTLLSVEGAPAPVKAFLGVPFAKPPLGTLRFAPPEPPEPWSHLRDAASQPPMCLQDVSWMQVMAHALNIVPPNVSASEDCLYLNVFTPDTEAKLPVLVSIHGGGLIAGSASMYDTPALSAFENVVLVVLQYRLGIPGFFSTGSKEAPGNWGLLDQVAALRWVQENIEAFGGDPTSVTIMGESAGGFSVGVQTVANVSGCENSSPAALVRCLRSKTEEELAALNIQLCQVFGSALAVVDGKLLPKAPEELLAAKEFRKVPYLIGINNHEYGWTLPQSGLFVSITEVMDRQAVTAAFQESAPVLNIPVEATQRALKEYVGETEDPRELRAQFLDYMGDVMFLLPSVRTARAHRDSGAPVYFYQFQHPPSIFRDTRPVYVKADHVDQVIFVSGTPLLRSKDSPLGEYTEEEKRLSKTMMRYWANFARSGNPNGRGQVKWPRYDQKEGYLELDLEPRGAQKLKQDKVDFWLKTLPEQMREETTRGKDTPRAV
ncbi:fatty acyl-CoA hydrolase precursor, medium chain isoform X2 [Anolis carolinensis]|uniref:fatty acyl-CoA hydrolase precursor, medium chain isoform X2 n=1 Tax=Anolis carolinensis TaxID=28377 RepID=UPI002F2B52CC